MLKTSCSWLCFSDSFVTENCTKEDSCPLLTDLRPFNCALVFLLDSVLVSVVSNDFLMALESWSCRFRIVWEGLAVLSGSLKLPQSREFVLLLKSAFCCKLRMGWASFFELIVSIYAPYCEGILIFELVCVSRLCALLIEPRVPWFICVKQLILLLREGLGGRLIGLWESARA